MTSPWHSGQHVAMHHFYSVGTLSTAPREGGERGPQSPEFDLSGIHCERLRLRIDGGFLSLHVFPLVGPWPRPRPGCPTLCTLGAGPHRHRTQWCQQFRGLWREREPTNPPKQPKNAVKSNVVTTGEHQVQCVSPLLRSYFIIFPMLLPRTVRSTK